MVAFHRLGGGIGVCVCGGGDTIRRPMHLKALWGSNHHLEASRAEAGLQGALTDQQQSNTFQSLKSLGMGREKLK